MKQNKQQSGTNESTENVIKIQMLSARYFATDESTVGPIQRMAVKSSVAVRIP